MTSFGQVCPSSATKICVIWVSLIWWINLIYINDRLRILFSELIFWYPGSNKAKSLRLLVIDNSHAEKCHLKKNRSSSFFCSFYPSTVTIFLGWLVRVTLLVGFGFLSQNIGPWGPMKAVCCFVNVD